MATRKRRGRPSNSDLAVDSLVELVADRVAERFRKLPSKEELRELQTEVRQLARTVEKLVEARPPRGRPPQTRVCTVRGCRGKHVARGLCSRHYQAARRQGEEAAATTSGGKNGGKRKAGRRKTRKRSKARKTAS